MVTAEQRAVAATAAAASTHPRPSLGAIWAALGEVPDPEIPAVSVLELGIVRAVEWDAADPGTLLVRVTPTYSGCPATELIMQAIGERLRDVGVLAMRLETVLSPPWSTTWLTPEGQRKLRAYGIAPPSAAIAAPPTATVDVTGISPLRRTGMTVCCPRCGAPRTQLVAQFGSTACKAHYRCLECLEPFDYFKPL